MRLIIYYFLLFFSTFVLAETRSDALNHLLPLYQFKDAPGQTYSLKQRMIAWDVPGISITAFDDGEVLWTHTQGVKNVAGDSVTANTVFQMASNSKPVTALIVLKAVEQGKVTLDEDVRPLLIPELKNKAVHPISLRQLLSHRAGFSVYGLDGFSRNEHYPSLAQVASGEFGEIPFEQKESNGEFAYSNVGYFFIQSVIENIYKQPFEEIARQQLFQPLGLSRMTFEQQNIENSDLDVAHGSQYKHWNAEGWNRYTGKSAAGLWASTSDYAKLLLAVYESYVEKEGAYFSPSVLKVISEPIKPFLGLGFFRHSDPNGIYLFHGGINKGFESHFIFYPELGCGAVITTNGQGGDGLALEVMKALSLAYQWPNYQFNSQQVERPNKGELQRYLGRYRFSDGFYSDITAQDGQLFIQGKDQFRYPMFKVSEKTYRTFGFVSDFEFNTEWFSDEISSVTQIAPWGKFTAEKEE